MARKITESLKGLGILLGWFHGLGSGLAFLVFSYQYARQHGFVSWLLLGEIIPMLKAIVWEVFLVLALVAPNSKFAEDSRHYDISRDASNTAVSFIVHLNEEGQQPTEEEIAELCEHFRLALSEARLVSDAYLDAVHPEFKSRYKEQYQESIRLILSGLEEKNTLAWMKALRLQHEWANWAESQGEDFNFPD